MALKVHDLSYKQMSLQILHLKTSATSGKWERAGDSRAYIYYGEGEGLHVHIYASRIQSVKGAS